MFFSPLPYRKLSKIYLFNIISFCFFQIIITQTNTNFIPLLFCSFIINFSKAAAIIKRPTSYARHAVRDRYACKTAAAMEHTISYARHAIRNRYAR